MTLEGTLSFGKQMLEEAGIVEAAGDDYRERLGWCCRDGYCDLG